MTGHRQTNTTQCVATMEPLRGRQHFGQSTMTCEPYADRESAINQHGTATRAQPCQSFDSSLAEAIRMIRRSAIGLTPRESQLLSDVARGRGRAFRMVAEVADIARYRCFDPADAAALAECIRQYTLSGHPGLALPFLDTLRYEGATNAMADEALVEHVLSPSRATAERLVETHVAQAIASRAVADLVYAKAGR